MPGLSFSNELISRDEVCYLLVLFYVHLFVSRIHIHCHVSHRAYTVISLV